MKVWVLATAIWMLAISAGAGPTTDSCRVERLARAKSACLAQVFDQGVLAMAQDISHLVSRLQAATASELIALERQYWRAQANWQRAVDRACRTAHARDRVAFQYCRIGTLAEREAELALSLARAGEDFGAPPDYQVPIPDAVEVLIPLQVPVPLPGGGEVRLPLSVPINP